MVVQGSRGKISSSGKEKAGSHEEEEGKMRAGDQLLDHLSVVKSDAKQKGVEKGKNL